MAKKRSLADDLADLASAIPIGEPSLDEPQLGDEARLLDLDHEDSLAEPPPSKRARKAPEKALRLRADIADDETLGGRTVSKAEAFGSGFESEDGDVPSGSDASRSGQEAGSHSDAGNAEDDEDRSQSDASGVEEEDDQSNLQEHDEGKEAYREDPVGQEHEDDEIEREDREAKALQQMKDRIAKESAKGQATRNQQALWDKLLEMRIRLQKSLTISQQLPRLQEVQAVRGFSQGCNLGLDAVCQELQSSIKELLSLQQAIVLQGSTALVSTPESSDSAAASETQEAAATAEQLWPLLEQSYKSIAEFRNSSLDRWYRKSMLGGGASLKGNLQTLNQSVSIQVLNLMKNPDRAVNRTQPDVRLLPRRLCAPKPDLHEDSASAVDTETFDDTDFYQLLLKEFLDASNAGGALEPAVRKRKIKPARDRRGSKGRRLRYDVQEKLVNFMVPKTYEEPAIASQLFRNLFARSK